MKDFTTGARTTVLMFVLAMLVLASLLIVYKDDVVAIYAQSHIGAIGQIINALIVALFALGMIRLLVTLFSYMRESRALVDFVDATELGAEQPLSENAKSYIAKRYRQIMQLNNKNVPIHVPALAAGLRADMANRSSFLRFIHSVLILLGVFGTVVSLSMALVGASDLLSGPDSFSEMDAIISGMSAALSSTITAIVCFVIFSFFYFKLNEARSELINGIEQVTQMHIMPQVSTNDDALVNELRQLTEVLHQAANRVLDIQSHVLNVNEALQETVADLRTLSSESGLQQIKGLLAHGFRLSPEELSKIDEETTPASGFGEINPRS